MLSLIIFTPFAVVLSILDWKIYRLPHALTLACLAAGMTVASAEGGLTGSVKMAVIGALAGFLFLGPLAILRPDWLGFGDAVYLTAIGSFVGWNGILIVVLVGSLSSVILEGGYRMITKRHRKIPFGTYLSAAAVLVIIEYARVQTILPGRF